jgi:predicted nucleic acid-binding protein
MTLRYLLDTDTCAAWLRGHTAVQQRIDEAPAASLGLSIVTLAELRYGAAVS